MKRFLKLAKEPSTWAGLAGVLGAAAIGGINVEGWTTVFSVLAGICGVVAMFTLDPADKEE